MNFEAAPALGRGERVQQLITLSGGLVSLALIGGLAIWGYQLLMRDVTGVPVIRAMESAYRVQPENPGGVAAAHQGLAVNEIAAVGTASGPTPEVTLAPAPAGLHDEDQPQRAKTPPTQMSATQPAAAPVPLRDVPEDASATDRAVAEALSGILHDPSAASDPANATPVDGASPRPLPRPRAHRAVLQNAAARIAPQPVPAAEIDATNLALGTRLVHLGAFSSPEEARAQWNLVGTQFQDYFIGKRRVIQKISSGGRERYRLRAEGFTDLADARRFCSALLVAASECIPVELK